MLLKNPLQPALENVGFWLFRARRGRNWGGVAGGSIAIIETEP